MEFSKNLDWLKESDEDDNLLADDELDTVEEEMNEGLYVDPSNYDKHNDLVDVVDKAGNAQKMTQATYDKNKDSGEFEKKEPEKKEEPSDSNYDGPDKELSYNDLKAGKDYYINQDLDLRGSSDDDEEEPYFSKEDLKKLAEVGVKDDNGLYIPAGTKFTWNRKDKYSPVNQLTINGVDIEMELDPKMDSFGLFSDISYEPAEQEEPKKQPKQKASKSRELVDKLTRKEEPSKELKQVETSLINASKAYEEASKQYDDYYEQHGTYDGMPKELSQKLSNAGKELDNLIDTTYVENIALEPDKILQSTYELIKNGKFDDFRMSRVYDRIHRRMGDELESYDERQKVLLSMLDILGIKPKYDRYDDRYLDSDACYDKIYNKLSKIAEKDK